MLEEAEKDFASALTANPTHAHFPHYQAVVHARKGELEMAVNLRFRLLESDVPILTELEAQ